MTLDTIVRRINYEGDDRTTCFTFPFKVWGEEQVVVYCYDPETPWTEENITQQTTVTLNDDNCGGAVIFSTPPASGVYLAIVREGNFLQEDQYFSGSRFDAHEIEDRFDEDAAERQELLDATARSIKVPNSSTQTPEAVYEELISGAAVLNNSLTTLTDLYNQAVYYYNLALGLYGEASYTQAKEVSFTVESSHIGEWVCSIPEGFKYHPTTHQLLVTIDGLALTPGTHFEEIGTYSEESDQIRFKINIYKGQQVYIKAMFLGTEDFNVKLQEMNDKVEAAEKGLQDIIESAKKELQGIIDSLGDSGDSGGDSGDSGGDSGGGGSYDNSGGGSFIQPTQGSCSLTKNYCVGCCLSLPSNVCYYYNTNTLHLAIDGLVLSPKYFEEIDDNNDNGATCVKLCDICLCKDQELYAWTDGFWCSQK